MDLVLLRICGFRRFIDAEIDLSPKLVVLIGENDAGKTSVLDALEILLDRRRAAVTDFRRDGSKIEITGTFLLDGSKTEGLEFEPGATRVRIRRTILGDLSRVLEIEAMAPDDSRLTTADGLPSESAQTLLKEFGLEPGKNKTERSAQFQKLRAEASRSLQWMPFTAAGFPPTRRLSADSYEDPVQELNKILANSVKQALSDMQTTHPGAFDAVTQASTEAVDLALSAISPTLKRYLPNASNVDARTTIDFTRPQVSCAVDIIESAGRRPLGDYGYGTRRRAWMAVDEARNSQRFRDASADTELRLYDEPDTALHYEAQRTLFRSIREGTATGGARAIVCTHAVTLIDRAPASSLRIVQSNVDGTSTISPLSTVDTPTLQALDRFGPTMGLSNLAVLFERAFLIVEGPTEELAVRELYKTLYSSEPGDDGIRLVNLDGCGAWRSVVSVLLNMRQHLAHFLLDQDCTSPKSSAKLTAKVRAELGIGDDAITLIGTKEFEDAFSDEVWLRVLNEEYARHDGATWVAADLVAVRASDKFSEEIPRLVYSFGAPHTRSNISKPALGECIARYCSRDEIPCAIVDALNAVRARANLASV